MTIAISQRTAEVDGLGIAWREAGDAPVLYLHGVPNSSVMWEPFLERTGGVAPDLPGFGDSDKPSHFDYSIAGYGGLLETFVDDLGLRDITLVMHDWGVVGLTLAQRRPDLVQRLVLMSTVPLVAGYRWHQVARAWRMPFVGEMAMGFTFRWNFRRAMPESAADEAWRHFDHGTQRAILKLYRSAPERKLEQAGAGLGEVKAPALVVWGDGDPYIPPEFAQRTADALSGPATVEVVEGAGHWSWLDRPGVVDSVAAFAS
jgi:pimeloyl-ACP methyl ester carboxylesterase